MEKIKKIVSITTILSTCIASLLLIMLLFELKLFGKSNGDVIVTFACLAVGGFYTINSLNMLDRNKILGWTSLGLIVASVVLIILTSWINLSNPIIVKVTIVLGLLSVLFSTIVSSGLELGKSKLILQVVVYIVVGVTCLLFSLILFSVVNLEDFILWFIMMIILSVVGVVVLKVLAKKNVNDMLRQDVDIVKVPKAEYVLLVEKAKKYDELMSANGPNNVKES